MSAPAFAMESELPFDDSGDSDSEVLTTSTSRLEEADTSAGGHDGGKLGAQDAFYIATRAKSLLSYMRRKLRDAERRCVLREPKTPVAEHGGAA